MASFLPDMVFSVNTSNSIEYYFTSKPQLLFASPAEFLSKPFTEVFPEEQNNLFIQMIGQVKESRQPVNFGYDLPSGNGTMRHYITEFVPCLDKNGVISNVLVMVKDVTKEEEKEAYHLELEQRFKRIIETSSSGIFFGNTDQRIVECNKAFCDILEIDPKEFTSFTFSLSAFTHPDDLSQELIQIERLVKNEINFYRLTKRYITTKKNIRWVDTVVSVVRDEEENQFFFVGIVNEITKEVELREHLKAMNGAKDRLFSIIGHDLRGSLGNIRNLSELILQINQPEEKTEMVRLIQHSSQSAINLLENLLEWGRSQSEQPAVKFEACSIFVLSQEAIDHVASQAQTKNIAIELDSQAEKDIIQADRQMIVTVLRNLLMNAVKFSFPGNPVQCHISNSETGVIVHVIDKGIGIPENLQKSMFNLQSNQSRSGTLNEKGSGLGLVVCADFVRLHNGTIQVFSQPDQGTTFTLYLPFNP